MQPSPPNARQLFVFLGFWARYESSGVSSPHTHPRHLHTPSAFPLPSGGLASSWSSVRFLARWDGDIAMATVSQKLYLSRMGKGSVYMCAYMGGDVICAGGGPDFLLPGEERREEMKRHHYLSPPLLPSFHQSKHLIRNTQ